MSTEQYVASSDSDSDCEASNISEGQELFKTNRVRRSMRNRTAVLLIPYMPDRSMEILKHNQTAKMSWDGTLHG